MFSTPPGGTKMRSSLFVSVILHTVLILLLLRLNVLPRNLSIVPVVHASRIQNAAVLLQAPRYPLYGAIRISQPATLVPARAQSNSNDVAWRTSPQSIPPLPDPPLAKRARVQGVVVLEASIGESGAVENVNVISGHPLLIPAALDAIRQWQYDPATLEGIPIRASVNITVNFNLHFAE